MNYKRFCRGSASLRVFCGDRADHTAEYAEYELDGVRLVRKTGSSPDMTSAAAAELYFFPAFSRCTRDGKDVPLPHLKCGDNCVIGGKEDEMLLRVSSAEYHSGYTDGDGSISHVKVILR